jgi:hypothetical protein
MRPDAGDANHRRFHKKAFCLACLLASRHTRKHCGALGMAV